MTMELRTAASISLIILAAAIGTVLIYHEIAHKNGELAYKLVNGDDIEEAGPMVAGDNEFWVKKELRSWGECLTPYFPLAIAVIAWLAKGKVKKKERA